MTTGVDAMLLCITRQRPASLIYPVFDRPMFQFPPLTSPFEFRYCRSLPSERVTAYAGAVVKSRISG